MDFLKSLERSKNSVVLSGLLFRFGVVRFEIQGVLAKSLLIQPFYAHWRKRRPVLCLFSYFVKYPVLEANEAGKGYYTNAVT